MEISLARTLLRPIQTQDAEAVLAYKSIPEVNQWLGWIPETTEDIHTFVAKNPKAFNTPDTWFQLVIVQLETNTVIGDIGLHFVDAQQCELGYTLHPKYGGQGYATEALSGLISYVFTQLHKHRIFASVDPDNKASIRLLKRLHFRKEAHHKQSLWFKEQWVDDVVYAMLRQDWIDQ